MAEAWLNNICSDYFEAHSAGLQPGQLNPLAVQAMREVGIDKCPIFPGVTNRLHWSFPDPSALNGTYRQQLEGTRKIRDDIRARIEGWCDEMCGLDA